MTALPNIDFGNEEIVLLADTSQWRIAMPSTLITGTNRGPGLEFASQYLIHGWLVYAALCLHLGRRVI
jgi:hypothetical protein